MRGVTYIDKTDDYLMLSGIGPRIDLFIDLRKRQLSLII